MHLNPLAAEFVPQPAPRLPSRPPPPPTTQQRVCSTCQGSHSKKRYSATQWKKDDGARRCKDCTAKGIRDEREVTEKAKEVKRQRHKANTKTTSAKDGGKKSAKKETTRKKKQSCLPPIQSTEFSRVRRDGTITPKDRLVKYLELNVIFCIGEMEGHSGLLPEIVLSGGDDADTHCGDETCSSCGPAWYKPTKYEYWGLPRLGSYQLCVYGIEPGSKTKKSEIRTRCVELLAREEEWFVANSDKVVPLFDDPDFAKRICRGGMTTPTRLRWQVFIRNLNAIIGGYAAGKATDRFYVENLEDAESSNGLVPLAKTKAYRDRINGTISPKVRLITYCELKVIAVVEKSGIPSQEELNLSPDVPQVISSYSYWGLPLGGSRNKSKAFKKKVRRHCREFLNLDEEYFIENFSEIEPYLEEVAAMGISHSGEVKWEGHIDEIKQDVALEVDDDELVEILQSEILGDYDYLLNPFAIFEQILAPHEHEVHDYGPAIWSRPQRLQQTAAYRMRMRGQIDAKTRLLQYCELRSLFNEDEFEVERLDFRLPPRVTNNRYWGIAPDPQPGCFEKDREAWSYFIDVEDAWIVRDYDKIRPLFRDIALIYPAEVGLIETKRLERLRKFVNFAVSQAWI